jgi:hypothetical protein
LEYTLRQEFDCARIRNALLRKALIYFVNRVFRVVINTCLKILLVLLDHDLLQATNPALRQRAAVKPQGRKLKIERFLGGDAALAHDQRRARMMIAPRMPSTGALIPAITMKRADTGYGGSPGSSGRGSSEGTQSPR